MTNDNFTTEEDGDQYNENANDHRDRSDNLSNAAEVQSFFQIMYYAHHIMNAESVHNQGRGGKIPSKHKTFV